MKQQFLRYFLGTFALSMVTSLGYSNGNIYDNSIYLDKLSSGKVSLVENKGQWNDSANFKADLPGGAVFLTDYGFRYLFEDLSQLQKAHDEAEERNVDNDLITTHVFDVSFVNSTLSNTYEKGTRKSTYYNYFLGNDPALWKSNVGLFESITQKNIYNNIDLVVYSNENSLKYDLVVHPGGQVSDILMDYDGVGLSITNDGKLKVTTAVNEYYESKPYTFQIIDGVEIPVEANFSLTNGKVGFNIVGNYNANHPLVIDPDLVFSTYSGATASNVYSYASTYDDEGHHYGGADIRSAGWPTQTGVFQTNFGGLIDVAINKISPDGDQLIYATFIGGSGNDEPFALLVNPFNNQLYVAGHTQSTNFPMHTDAHIGTMTGAKTPFLFYLSEDGTTMEGSTYITSAGNNYGTFGTVGTYSNGSTFVQNRLASFDIAVTGPNEVWIGGNINSSNITMSANSIQGTYGGGQADALLIKYDGNLTEEIFSTYLGGSGVDGITALKPNEDGNLVVVGITSSSDFPTTSGAFIEEYPGSNRHYGFASVINNFNYQLIGSTYLGVSTANNQAVDLAMFNNEIYVLGRTRGNYPVTPGVYSMGANRDLFIHVLNADLTEEIKSTTVGFPLTHSTALFPTAFTVDDCGYTYVAGLTETSSTSLPGDMPFTSDAFSTNLSNKFYFMAIDDQWDELLFGSSFGSGGSDHTHYGRQRMDPGGVVYHSICANATNYPITPGVFAPNKQTSGQDIVSFKFALGANKPLAEISILNQADTVGCAPHTVDFQSVASAESEYFWDFGNGDSSTDQNPQYTYYLPGEYQVVLTVTNYDFCIPENTDTINITVHEAFMPIISTEDREICYMTDTLELHVDIANWNSNMSINWGNNPGILTSNSLPTIVVDPSVSLQYIVTVSDSYPGYCDSIAVDTINILYAPGDLEMITNDTAICQGTSVEVNSSGAHDYAFQWSPTDGVLTPNSPNTVITPSNTEVYTLTASHPNCPDTSVTIAFIVEENPELVLSNDTTVCVGTKVAIEGEVNPYNADYTYSWSPTSGLFDFDGPNAYTIAEEEATYSLTVTTPLGCTASDTFTVDTYPILIATSSTDDTGYCPPNSVDLEVYGGYHYNWSPHYGLDRPDRGAVTASPETPTEYTIIVTDTNQCKDTLSIFVDVYSNAVIEIPDTVVIYSGEEYHLNPYTNGMYFNWFPPSGISDASSSNPYFSPEANTRYFVTATTENGCIIEDSIDFIVRTEVFDLPNAFNPKSGNNFKVEYRGNLELEKFQIFNRWGNLVYSSTDIDEGWNGKYNDESQPTGVYVWQVEVRLPNGKIEYKSGNVTLIH